MHFEFLVRLTSGKSKQAAAASRRGSIKKQLFVEYLETRDLLSGFYPTYILDPTGSGIGPGAFASQGPTGTTPAQIRHAYGIDQISFNNGTIQGDGTGTTIAIVDAYDDPKIANDLHQFDLKFGLPEPTFTKVNQSGGTTMPTADGGWSSEIALDVEWSHAIAPKANILLVEANDSSYTNLFAAVTYAAKQPGVVAVSMSFGGGEFSGETSFDSVFMTPSGHSGVTFIASSGDSGAPASYPAASPNVLAVGGTTTIMNSSGTISSESGWSGSGGGISTQESQPTYQKGVVTQSTTRRTNPDVAYDADPNTGFPVYDSYNNPVSAPWSQFGGTSDAAPQWAALIAIADQGRALAGEASLDGPSQTLPKIYALPAADFHDVTTGSSTGSPAYAAGTGYDLVTGRGTPVANLLVAGLVGTGQTTTGVVTHFSVTGPSSSSAGSAFTVIVTAMDASNHPVTGYRGTIQFTSSDTAGILPASYTFVSGDSGAHTFTSKVTFKTAGTEVLTVTDTTNGSLSGSLNIQVNAGAATHLVFMQQPTAAGIGSVINPAVTVRLLDQFNNLVSGDNTDKVTLSIGTNPGGGALGGRITLTVSGGVATFSNLSISKAGVGYTLVAKSGTFVGVTSTSFNVSVATAVLLEGFEGSSNWNVVGPVFPTAYLSTVAAHDGNYGLVIPNGPDWLYRVDSAAQIKAGDTISVWVKLAGAADGQAFFAFGASASGTLSFVLSPSTGQLMLLNDVGYGLKTLAAVGQSYSANHWYRMEVDWGASGSITGKLYDSNGSTLLGSVAATTTVITSGGFGFRATGSNKYWDTVTAQQGVNTSQVGPHIQTSGSETFLAIGPSGLPTGIGFGLDALKNANPGGPEGIRMLADSAFSPTDYLQPLATFLDSYFSTTQSDSLSSGESMSTTTSSVGDGWWEPISSGLDAEL